MKTTFDFNSIPDKMEELFNPETSTEKQIEICERHNLKIASLYNDNLTRAKTTLEEFEKVVFLYDLPIEKYQLTKRRLLQVKGIWKTEIIKEINSGVTINGIGSEVIKQNYQILITFLNEAIPVLDNYIEIVDSTILKIDNKEVLHTNFNLKQLDFIFDEMRKHKYFVDSQKKQFLNTFQGKTRPGTDLLKWNGSKSLIFYFMQQITERDNITRPEINKYITPPIRYNDNYTGENYHSIEVILKEAKKVK